MASAEHQFLAEQIDVALKAFSTTGLLGVTEAERRKFDYACRLRRDFLQPLVSQVCWGNVGGISKDLQLLLLGSDAPIKLYLVSDSQPARLKLDEALRSYHDRPETRALLRGFRYLPVPTGFDADNEAARTWMGAELKRLMCSDLLFGVMFGHLSKSDVHTFAEHGGPIGLKYAMLHHVSSVPTLSVGDIGSVLGTKSKSSMREGLIMLTATGLLYQKPRAQPWFPTVKGRFLLDLIRRLLWEAAYLSDWTVELRIILSHLGMPGTRFVSLDEAGNFLRSPEYASNLGKSDMLLELLESAMTASGYGVDPLSGIDRKNPQLYSAFDWRRFAGGAMGDSLTAAELGAPEAG
jgi:hypothetical protein